MGTNPVNPRTKVSLVFDDGFTQSCLKVADCFEKRGLSATFAVLVEHKTFMPAFHKGEFSLWNTLQARGHIIHPHGFDHTDLTSIPHEHAVSRIDACLEYFSKHLDYFEPASTIYHATYNRTTPELNAYLLTKVRAVRSTGLLGTIGNGMNHDAELERRVLSCAWHGPDHCDEHLLASLVEAERVQPRLFLYMLHGLDEEGWGPIRSQALERALDFIEASPMLEYWNLSSGESIGSD